MTDKSYGSGHFGEWIEDAFGLPAYRYTCDQTRDPKAVTPVGPLWRGPTDHSHQVGNDRLVGVASNYGYVQVRQDEGSPKYLNDYDPANHRYGGGLGYLTDGATHLSTYYSGEGGSFERVFGVGYYRKTVREGRYTADQVIFAPYGDDPLLISQVTITNHGSSPADLRWVEYWDSQMYQFSYRAMIMTVTSRGKVKATEQRRQFASCFKHTFLPADGHSGIVASQEFTGYHPQDRRSWRMAQFLLATVGRSVTGGPVKPPVEEAALEDLHPPAVFLVSLDSRADGTSTDGAAFFGSGGAAHPDGLSTPLPDALTRGQGTALLLERRLHLGPGASRTLSFAYGYLPEGVTLDALLAPYRRDLGSAWGRSCQAWRENRIELETPDAPWVDRELLWHHYYLRSNLTYDTFFREHILSQGHVYQYLIGFQGAARDPLQHALPFIFTDPAIVRQVIRYTLKEVKPDGEIPYGIVGHGMVMPAPFHPSDLEMWLLWLASEYVLATRDTAFLDETLPTYPLYGPGASRAAVHELLARCFRHLVEKTGVAQHGLMRISNGDWNDLAVIGFVPKNREKDVRTAGESVLNAAFASYTLDLYARMLAYVGDSALAEEASQKAEEQRRAVREQWLGGWFRRAWLTEDIGWIGEDVMWLEPQPWAIIGGAATPEQRRTLVEQIDELVRKPSPIGAMILSKPLERSDSPPGDGVNAGIWPSINGTLIWALALVNGAQAWDEWKKNSLACHAEAYPDIWYGIWSGPDTLNSCFSEHPGMTVFDEKAIRGEGQSGSFGMGVNWTDFPVMNMHPHAWPLYDVFKLTGVAFTPKGLDIAPALPEPSYRVASPLLGVEKSPDGYAGWYAPAQPGEWQVVLRLQEDEAERFSRLVVNGHEREVKAGAGGSFVFSGASQSGQPLRWALS